MSEYRGVIIGIIFGLDIIFFVYVMPRIVVIINNKIHDRRVLKHRKTQKYQ